MNPGPPSCCHQGEVYGWMAAFNGLEAPDEECWVHPLIWKTKYPTAPQLLLPALSQDAVLSGAILVGVTQGLWPASLLHLAEGLTVGPGHLLHLFLVRSRFPLLREEGLKWPGCPADSEELGLSQADG